MDLQAQKATRARRATKVDGQFAPHLVLALEWAQRVLDGKVPAGKVTKKCVKRFLAMVEQATLPAVFSISASSRPWPAASRAAAMLSM